MMYFAEPINRPPYEKADGFLQVTEGCSHGTCKFCSYFKTEFKRLSIEEIERDVRQIPETYGQPTRIFLQGADAFSADYDILMATAELIHEYVPSVKTIGGFARVDSFTGKTVEQLKSMHEAGYEDPYFGLESGWDKAIEFMNKGWTIPEARTQLEKLEVSGMPYIVNYCCGVGGKGNGLVNARETAKLYDGIHPTMLNMTMLTVIPDTPLWDAVKAGEFEEESEIEKLEETQELIRNLNCETVFMNEHASNFFHLICNLPDQKEAAIAYIQNVIDTSSEEELRKYRESAIETF